LTIWRLVFGCLTGEETLSRRRLAGIAFAGGAAALVFAGGGTPSLAAAATLP
jgi:L-serine deaminase